MVTEILFRYSTDSTNIDLKSENLLIKSNNTSYFIRTALYFATGGKRPWKQISKSIFHWSSVFLNRDHSFSTYAILSKKLTFLTPSYVHLRVRVTLSENFAYVLNEWSLSLLLSPLWLLLLLSSNGNKPTCPAN